MEHLMASLQSMVNFIVVISVLIVVHEWGHFITAKKLGIKVEKFALGFGPKLFSVIHDNTEFLICAVPLGGYVKMAGDERHLCKGAPDEFYSKSPGHRALVVVNGPVVNFILAYVCLILVFILGYPDLSTKVGQVSEDYPAHQAGMLVGDHLVRIEGVTVESWAEVQETITNSIGETLTVEFVRDGQTLTKILKPKVEKRENIFGQKQVTRIIGIAPTEDIVSLKYSVGESFVKAFEKLVEITTMTYKALYFMVTGSMSAKESMTGPIGIFYIIKTAAEMGLNHLLFIVGVISASLAIFNLLPMLPLDGGHLFLLAIEKLRGRPLSAKIDEFIAKVGFGFIIMLAIYVFYSDFSRFGWIDKIKGFFS